MYTIIAGIDTDTDRAESIGDTIATMPFEEAHAVLVHVFDENTEGAGIRQVGAVKHARERLETVEGVELLLEGRSGDPSAGVLEVAREHDANLICVAGRKRTPTGKALFGSVSQEIILGSEYPVLVCDSEQAP